MAEEVIYAKSLQDIKDRKKALLLDLAAYFGVSYAFSITDKEGDKAWELDESAYSTDQLAVLCRQFKYVVIPSIYKNKERKKLWSSICTDDRFIVCIDLFYYGLVFYREEQRKELFKLRFPYWR